MTKDYWKQREKNWINSNIKQDQQFDKELEKYYNQALKDIQSQINQFYLNYAKAENLSLTDAMKQISNADIEKLAQEAAQMVPNKDFSDYANQQMRLYNATMRINRLEMIKSQIGQTLVEHGAQVEKSLKNKLSDSYLKEIERQAGIFGDYKNSDAKLKANAETVVNASYQNAQWSERLWNSMSALQATVGIDLTNALTQGLNPEKLQHDLMPMISDDIKNKTYVAQRLARTEMARVQDQAQMTSFNNYGVRYVKWIAEPSACRTCREIADADEGIYPIQDVPDIPIHPNCRCSKAGDARSEFEDYLARKRLNPQDLDDDKLGALNKYISFDSYPLNEALRKGDQLTSQQKQMMTNLDKALNKLPKFDGSYAQLNRSYKFQNPETMDSFLDSFKEQDIYEFKSYVSTSKGIYDSEDDVRMIILNSHSGSDLKGYNDAEQEVLFKRGTMFKILDMYFDETHKPIIVLEELK
ncbi:minor capsid protein [Bombilactobacillus folatiphilus]|uniref:Minor capsid protein n=1 Tax=Bombilactobacillus folatiphilus TaxID=2923362 RepID=A0ABY4P7F1_9LACO|nr:minor capsid protein [Bombilactobacillus folatiphilus]UQS81563.1 minor capsid protein [Bombilactobacillus folatiphilus]